MNVLRFSERITCLPVIHGSGEFALEVRRIMLEHAFDCVAVPLPESFQADVERGIEHLPTPSIVTQVERRAYHTGWAPDVEEEDEDDEFDDEDFDLDDPGTNSVNFVPIDPCQGVIMALRVAMGEHIPRVFIDLEVSDFQPYNDILPDAYALKQVPLEKFAAALLPSIRRLSDGQPQHRIRHMARRLRQLERRYQDILFVCNVLEWPWIREAYKERLPVTTEHDDVESTELYGVEQGTLLFMLGELPFITGLYERARAELEDDENLSIDGVKELLLASRAHYQHDLKTRARKITPHLLAQCLKYIRNLSLIENRMTPDLYSIVMAAKQVGGDQYALHVAETARAYRYAPYTGFEQVRMGIDRARFPNDDVYDMINRLEGPPVVWRSCQLQRRPDKKEIDEWKTRWNPYGQCSWPPEDELIENFRSHVMDRAKQIMGADLVRTEKFTTSIMDGIDIRDTLRHWYDDEIWVKVLPPVRGDMDCVVMLFDSPADPRDYPWRTTWFAEHVDESTLAFFGTNFHDEMVGPGICLATYGGAMFLYPPVAIPDIWNDLRLDFCETLEERLLAAACLHSQSQHIALLSSAPPGAGWRRLAKRFHKKWVHVPLGQFSDATVQQLRMVHVLNGKEVRSFASHFIRKA